MNKSQSNLINDYEVVGMIVGFVVAIGFLSLPSDVANEANQDGWISILVGAIYPLVESLICIYFIKKHPNENILELSKRFLGKTLGTILNFLFTVQCILYIATMASALIHVFMVFATPFLNALKIVILAMILAVFSTTRGIKALSRINKITLWLKITISSTLVLAIYKGSYFNLLPVLQANAKSVFRGSLQAAYSYLGIETIFLIYPLIKNKDKAAKLILKANLVIISMYLWIVVVTIYYLGYKVTSKSSWPVLLVTESVDLPLLNSTRFLFLLFWALNMFTIISNYYYVFITYFHNTINISNKINIKKYHYLSIPVFIGLTLAMGDVITRGAILNFITPKIIIFNFFYIITIALLIFVNDKFTRRA